MRTLFLKIRKFLRKLFKYKAVVISCVTKRKGVIAYVGGTDEGESFFLKKEELIKRLRDYEKEGYTLHITTKKKNEVQIIENNYLRTKPDKNNRNDLHDLPSCE